MLRFLAVLALLLVGSLGAPRPAGCNADGCFDTCKREWQCAEGCVCVHDGPGLGRCVAGGD